MSNRLRKIWGTTVLIGGILAGWCQTANAAVMMEPLPASADLPSDLAGVSASGVLNGSILVTGGQYSRNNSFAKNSYTFSPSTQTWSTYAPALNLAYHTQSEMKDGRVIVTGGNAFLSGTGYVYNNLTRIYSPYTNAWTQASNLPKNMLGNSQSTLPDGRIVSVGGADSIFSPGSSTLYNNTYIYDPAANTWTEKAPLPIGIYGAAQSTLADGRILLTGGLSGYVYSFASYIYDPAADTWTKAAGLPYQYNDLFFRHAQVTLPNGKVLVMGNYNFYLYDPVSNTWAQDTPSLKRLQNAKMSLTGGSVYVMGGYDENYGLNTTVYKLSFDFTAPTAPVITTSSADWSPADVTATLTAGTDADSGVKQTEYSLSGVTVLDWTPYTAGDVISVTNSGETTISARTIDKAGNASSVTTAVVKVDKTAPTAPVIKGASSAWTNQNASITLTPGTDKGGSGVQRSEYKLSGGTTQDWTAYTEAVPISTEGITTVHARTIDNVGNVSAESTADVSIDKAPPTTPSVQPAVSGWSKDNVAVTITPGTDARSGVKRTEYSLSGASTLGWTAYTGPVTVSAEGQTTVSARSVDEAGNISQLAAASVSIDKTAPGAATVTPAFTSWTASGVQVTVKPGTDAGSGVYRTEYSLSGATTLGWVTYTGLVTVTAEGVTTLHARVIDQAGNVSTVTTADVKIDRTAPGAPSISPAGTSWVSSDVLVTLTGGDAVSGLNRLEYSLSGAVTSGWKTYTGPVTVTAEGQTTLTARSFDNAGNVSQTATAVMRIDKTAPTVPAVTPGTTGWTAAASVPVTVNAGTDTGGSGVKITEYSLSGAVTKGWTAYTGPLTVTAPGQTTVIARTTDGAGNVSAAGTATVSIDRTPPAAPGITPSETGWTSASGVSVAITHGADTGGAGVSRTEFSLSGAETLGWTAYTGPLSVKAEGQTTVTARTVDKAGNVSLVSSIVVKIDRTPPGAPAITAPADQALLRNISVITGTAEPSSFVVLTIDGKAYPAVQADTAGKFTYTLPAQLADGTHNVTAAASDAAGNTSPASGTVSFTLDTAAPAVPVILFPVDGTLTKDAKPVISGTAEARSFVHIYMDGSLKADVQADGAGIWSYAGADSLKDGTHTVRVYASDEAGNNSASTKTITWTVDATPPPAPVVLTPAGGSSTNRNQPVISGTSEPGSLVRVELDGTTSAGSATADGTGKWSLTSAAPLADGTYSLRTWAEDKAGNAGPYSGPLQFTVDTQAPAVPVIRKPLANALLNTKTPKVEGHAEAGAFISVVLDGSIIHTVTSGPDGSWVYIPASALADGSHTVKASAADAAGNRSAYSAETVFRIDATAPAAPVITEPAPGTVTNVNRPLIRGTAETSVTVNVYVDGTHAGITTTGTGDSWSFSPGAALSAGTHRLTAIAVDAAGNESPLSPETTFTVVSSNAALHSLSLGGAALNETVTGSTYRYTAQVPHSVTVTSIQATAEDAQAAVRLLKNGQPVTNPVALEVGDQTFTVEITAQDGVTVTPYTVTVTRAASSEVTLSELTVTSGELTPRFDGATTVYSTTVTNDVYAVTVGAKASSSVATVTINGTAFGGNAGSLPLQLKVGSNPVTVTVTAQDGVTTQSYQLEVSRAPSSNVLLSGLILSEGILEPAFDSGMVHYRAAVGPETSSLSVTASVYEPNATLVVNGLSVVSGQPSVPLALKPGLNPITVVVTAQDGITTQSYVVDVTRQLSSNAGLTGLELSAGRLSPAFDGDTSNYALTVDYENDRTTVTASVYDPDALVTVNGVPLLSGKPSAPLALRVGANPVQVTVTAPDGQTVRTYTVLITRQPRQDSGGESPGTSPGGTPPTEEPKPPVDPGQQPGEPGGTGNPGEPGVPGKPEVPGGLGCPSPPPHPVAFKDMKGHWAAKEVARAADCGIVSGFENGTFRPQEQVTRAQFTVMLTQAYAEALRQLEKPAPASGFADSAGIPAWAAEAVALAQRAGIATGYGDGTFRPDAPVTRAEMLTLAAKAAQLQPVPAGALHELYADADEIPGWAAGYVAAAQQKGLVQGRGPRTFDPLGYTTRAEAVTLLLRMLESK
ncbi:OmpL47-type beta-barrel domain-containing protein [Paenibacillus chitinolyticus]|uniref:OmpL47-type beta-barrel domain-containing protein n=1 Tax=Paenibacillus chitinolyticus TaxID=79263 RepID=UPI001C43D991|nr:Ig-like domain-containing protein [Paenibacillus chitinolyticus]MBV6717567.1 cadherin-like beta sandwich domain-containing protein [Paenibacillus chitinolyticus]